MSYSIELIDKGVSTDELNNDEEDDKTTASAQENLGYNQLEAILTHLVETKIISIRECEEEAREKRRLLSKFRNKSNDSNKSRINSTSSVSSSPVNKQRGGSILQPLQQQSFESYDTQPSRQSESTNYNQGETRIHQQPQQESSIRSTSLPLKTAQNWINTSVDTATTSSGYISPSSKQQQQKQHLQQQQTLDEEKQLRCDDETCDSSIPLPPCLSTSFLPSSCSHLVTEYRETCGGPSYRHDHVTGGHYVSCCNSPTHSINSKAHYEENYVALTMNLEDLEFEAEEERRKKRKRKKKRRKERLRRSRGLMADEIKLAKNTPKDVDPEDLPKRARWTIVATACLLLLMSLMLVGVTLRMAPIIDEMVRKENEELLNSLNRQGEDWSSNQTSSSSHGAG